MVAQYLRHGPFLRRIPFRLAFAAKPSCRLLSKSASQFKRCIAPIHWRELGGHGLKLNKECIAVRKPYPGHQSRRSNVIEYVVNGFLFLGGVGSMVLAASFSSTESPEAALYNPTIPTIWTNPLWVFHEPTQQRRQDIEVEQGLREPMHSEYPGSFSGVEIERDSKPHLWVPAWEGHHNITTYEAVSYAWRDLTVPKLIQCDGQPRVISLNLYQALHSFRHVYEPRILWVDALCINQADNLEKAHQVSTMGEIYAGARRVLIWLGYGSDLEKAFGLLMRGQLYQLNLIQHLMSAPWFSRVWCVQELARAADPVVTVGKRMAPWDLYVRQSRLALKEIRAKSKTNQDDHLDHAEILDDIRSRYENVQKRRFKQPGRRQSYSSAWRAGGASLVELLFLTRDFKATDPRDKIFALVGIASDVQEQDVEVFPRWILDLTQSNTFTPFQKLPHGYNYSKDNFYNVFNYLEEWLTMLKANEDGRIEKLQFFHTDVHNPVCAGWTDWRDRSLLAKLPPIKVSHAGHVLHLKGKYVSTVSRLTDRSSGQLITDITISPKDALEPSQKWLRDCWEIVFSVMLESQTDSQLAILFDCAWRAIICDTTMAVERDLSFVVGDEVGNGF
ncbi:hypothetical protein K456DRAFT_1928769 [Colletotrichum gloeosporioides 23]|nr:hypothetical protein K456DRAFT_1928769 [Colletotrichum gloeosporioides 23]